MDTTVVIIGAGQAGLAMSRCLTDRSIEHVLIERGEVANSWRTERWDSLRLLTPNWLTRLPGWAYRGPDPEGYMTAGQVVTHLDAYRRTFDAPVVTRTAVRAVRAGAGGFAVDTDGGRWTCRAVVDASGAASQPKIPAVHEDIPARTVQLAPLAYRNPDQLPEGGVLVVGASASGVQIADELLDSGRSVTIAVGDHVRAPRSYRGMDIHWWMDAIGLLDERYDEVDDIARARRLPSLQLIGSPEHRTLDLTTLTRRGADVVGRFVGVRGGTAQFSGSAANLVASADLKLRRLLDRIDTFAAERGLDAELEPPSRPVSTALRPPATEVDLGAIETVVWATGYRPHHPWLEPHLLDQRGGVRHDGGVVTEQPGLYVLGLPFMRRRSSSFLGGVGRDAAELATHLHAGLGRSTRLAQQRQ